MTNILSGYGCNYVQTDTIIIVALVVGLIVGVAIDLILAHVAGRMGENKGYGYWGFWALTLFIGILSIIIVACLPETFPKAKEQKFNKKAMWICPCCGKANSGKYVYCKFCGADRQEEKQEYSGKSK